MKARLRLPTLRFVRVGNGYGPYFTERFWRLLHPKGRGIYAQEAMKAAETASMRRAELV